jgi:RNA polymerase sigma-70 factor (ECF subfamily)
MSGFEDFNGGSETAFDAFVAENAASVVRYCYGILCNYSDADDAAQLTFIKIYRKRATIREERSVRAFLYRAAYRTCVDIIRKRRLLLLPGAAETAGGSYTEGYDRDFPEDLKDALMSLAPFDRALVYDRAVSDVPYEELAAAYGRSAPSLRKRYERARRKLAETLNARVAVDTRAGINANPERR